MATEAQISISLTEYHIDILDKLCKGKNKRYKSRSEAIRRAIELLKENETKTSN